MVVTEVRAELLRQALTIADLKEMAREDLEERLAGLGISKPLHRKRFVRCLARLCARLPFTLGPTLGTGGFGSVHRGVLRGPLPAAAAAGAAAAVVADTAPEPEPEQGSEVAIKVVRSPQHGAKVGGRPFLSRFICSRGGLTAIDRCDADGSSRK